MEISLSNIKINKIYLPELNLVYRDYYSYLRPTSELLNKATKILNKSTVNVVVEEPGGECCIKIFEPNILLLELYSDNVPSFIEIYKEYIRVSNSQIFKLVYDSITDTEITIPIISIKEDALLCL